MIYRYPQAEFPYEELVRQMLLVPEWILNSSSGTTAFCAKIAISISRSNTPRQLKRYSHPDHGHELRTRTGYAAFAADALVSQYLELGSGQTATELRVGSERF